MKETNMEHFRSEIEKVLDRGAVIAVSKDGRRVFECNAYGICEECLCGDIGKLPCDVKLMQWLMSEYKPEPVLTQREKHFVEFAETGWVTRDKSGTMWWSQDKPEKDEDSEAWLGKTSVMPMASVLYRYGDFFSFITWEDEEPWDVEELRKLKVSDENSSV